MSDKPSKPDHRLKPVNSRSTKDGPGISAIANTQNGKRLNRREFIRTGAAWITLLGAGTVLKACGSGGGSSKRVYETVAQYDKIIESLNAHEEGYPGGVASFVFSPDGSKLISGGALDDYIKIWKVSNGNLLNKWEQYTDGVFSVAISPDSATLACSGYHCYCVAFWKMTGESYAQYIDEGPEERDPSDPTHFTSLSFSPDGSKIATVGTDNSVKIWNVSDCSQIYKLEGHTDTVVSVAYSPDGTKIASGGYDKTIKIWNALNGSLIQTLSGSTDEIFTVAFSPDGLKLVSGGHNQSIIIWDAVSGALLKTILTSTESVTSAKFNPDGTKIVSGGSLIRDDWTYGKVDVISVANGNVIRTIDAHQSVVTCVAFSRDGAKIATASMGGYIGLWDSVTGDRIRWFTDPDLQSIISDDYNNPTCEPTDPSTIPSASCTCDCLCSCEAVRICSCDIVCTCHSNVTFCKCNTVCRCYPQFY